MLYLDSIRYVKMGLLIGTKNPELAEKLMKLNSLGSIGVLINEELGTNIQRGDQLQYVIDKIKIALDASSDDIISKS